MLWIFLWDDEIDQDSSEIAQNEADAVDFIQDSLKYAEMALGLTGSASMDSGIIIGADSETFSRPISTMTYFLDACEALTREMDIGLFHANIERFRLNQYSNLL